MTVKVMFLYCYINVDNNAIDNNNPNQQMEMNVIF